MQNDPHVIEVYLGRPQEPVEKGAGEAGEDGGENFHVSLCT